MRVRAWGKCSKWKRIVTRELRRLVIGALASIAPVVVGAENGVLYNHIYGGLTPLDNTLHEHYGQHYKVVDFSDQDHSWVYPRPVTSSPPTPVYRDGRCIEGHSVVAY